MGAKTKMAFPVVQHTEMDNRTCECSKDDNCFQQRDFFKCKDNFCQTCLRRIANPRIKSHQRIPNIPTLCHVQSANFENKRSDFQKLLRAQRKSSFLDLLPSKLAANPYTDEILCVNIPIIRKVVTATSLKQSVGSVPSYTTEHVTQSNHSCGRVPIASQLAINFIAEGSPTDSKISVDDTAKSRIKDHEGYIRRAACVCVNEDETKVVLISSKNDGVGWLIPGGGLEDGEEEIVAATREAWEEAGIKGIVTRWLGVFQYKDDTTKKKKRTSVFVIRVAEELNEFPEANLGRVRRWFDLQEAKKLLSICKPNQIAYLDSLVREQ